MAGGRGGLFLGHECVAAAVAGVSAGDAVACRGRTRARRRRPPVFRAVRPGTSIAVYQVPFIWTATNPFAVDGLELVASLVLLPDRRNSRRCTFRSAVGACRVSAWQPLEQAPERAGDQGRMGAGAPTETRFAIAL
jgi:hypothetical protein